jgi:PKD repeat protein
MKKTTIFFTFLLLFAIKSNGQNVVYVDQNASGANDGSSWANAYTRIQDALIIPNTGKEIWIAKGTYSPGNSRTNRYHLSRTYKFYGNFAGNESSKNQRIDTLPHTDGSYRTNETIICGDIGTIGLASDNIANLFVIDDNGNFIPTVTFNTLCIENAYSDVGLYDGVASGIYSNNAQLVLSNMLFKNNTVVSEYTGKGGAVYSNSYTRVYHSVFLNNTVETTYANTSHIAQGGAICLEATGNISNSYFKNNAAIAVNSNAEGGAIYITANLTIYHSILTHNHAKTKGGAVRSSSASYFRNCLISKNTASQGAGVFLHSTTDMLNTTISCNSATSFAGGIWFENSAYTYKITNSIIWGNHAPTFPDYRLNVGTTNFTYSLIPGYIGGTNNLDTNPHFIDTLVGNFRLSASSPCKDLGDNNAATSINPPLIYDLDGNTRIINSTIDMGAYEAPLAVSPVADFTANNTNITVGDSVSFTDLSTNTNAWNWEFAVGDPSGTSTPDTSINQHPSATYNYIGTYSVKLIAHNSFGADTLEKTDYITVHPVYEFSDTMTICAKDTLLWRANNYWSSGIYYDSLQTYFGADSVYILHLTVYPVFESVDSASICENDVYTWRGNNYSLAGVYYDSLTTQRGCDSVYVLDLSLNPLPTVSLSALDSFYCDYNPAVTMVGNPSGGNFLGQGVSANVFNPALAGLGIWPISYSYTDSLGCSNADTVYVTVDACVDVENHLQSDIIMYPNPSGDFIRFINLITDELDIKIFNQSGQLIKSCKNQKQIYVGDLNSGIYFVQLLSIQHNKTWKLIKE